MSSAGGTQKLVTNNPTDVASAEGRSVGKVKARSSEIFSAKTFNFNYNLMLNDSHIDTHITKKELNMQTSFGLLGGTDKISIDSKSTNHRRGRARGI